ncbi:MAG: outer membrane beta-barrel protein, partial [Bacteroidaceae bacterium]|nr:outer membrane beta-barrel protein [Bacteroidaceae bacterium]
MSYYFPKTVSMHRQLNMAANDIMLGTATVKASLVKMVVDNDTIVYNAGAFHLAEGSMLDGLIRQLPGAEIRDNQIYVNGEFVQSLLVNGKDFFKGDPAIALENLPAYMVNKIKVFRRETEEQQTSGMKVSENEKELVMDVRLKREFNTGWAANVQGGLGTDNRWLARLFGLRFTTNSRFAVYANLNNTNDNRNPGESTDWRQDFIYDGMSTRKKGGAMWSLSIPKQKMDMGVELHAQHKDVNTESKASRLHYLQNSDMWSRSRNTSKLCENLINMSGRFSWNADLFGGVSFFKLEPKLEYLSQKKSSLSRQAQLDSEPYERYRGAVIDSIFLYGGSSALTSSIVNRVENEGKGDRDRLRTSGYWYASPGFPLPDNLYAKWEGHYSFENNKEKNFFQYNLDFPKGGADDVYHHNYIFQKGKNYDYDIKTHLIETIGFKGGFRQLDFGLIHTYRQQYTTNNRDRYLLENLPDWSQGSGKEIADLPSTRDEMQLAIDAENSYYSTLRHNINTFDFLTTFQGYKDIGTDGNHYYINTFKIDIHFPIRLQTDRLNYDRSILNVHNRRRHLTFFEPNASIEYFGYKLSWSLSHDAPNMLYLLPIRDDTDPLNISTGNENLKDTHHHRFAFRKEWKQQQLGSTSSFNIDWHIMQNAIAMGRTYDSQTGITTRQPENVNGNWTLSATYRLNRPLDKAKRLFMGNATTVGYANSADLVSTDLPYAVRSSVRSAKASEELSLSYKIKQCSFGGRFGVNWINARSDRANFETVNCENWLLGANATIPLPWKMQLAADLST